jgi:hypothetical protein
LPAFSAVNWPVRVGLEGNFTFLTAFRAYCLVHLSIGHRLFSTPLTVLRAKIASYTMYLSTTEGDIRFAISERGNHCGNT